MIRRILRSALCICLSPLLVAQQTVDSSSGAAPHQVHIDLTGNPQVRFLIPQISSLAVIRAGDLVQLMVGTDITSGNATLLHSGVPVVGVVAKVRHSSNFLHRDGQIYIRVVETVSGNPREIVLRCNNPADPYVANSSSPRAHNTRRVVRDLFILGGIFLIVVLAAKGPIDG
jgi:hypothetical protein